MAVEVDNSDGLLTDMIIVVVEDDDANHLPLNVIIFCYG